MHKYLFMALAIILANPIFGQEQARISERYTDQNLNAILSDLEDKYDLKLYYKKSWLNNEKISISIEDKSISDALNMIVTSSDLSAYSVQGNVYVLLKEAQENQRDYEVNISGRIMDGNSGNPVPNAFIRIPEIDVSTVSDLDGNYSMNVKAGTYLITVKTLNSDLSREVRQLYEDQTLDLEVFEKVVELDDVVITGRSIDENLSNSNPGMVTFHIESIRKLPNLLGETDLSRIILSLPGVQTVGEGATGFNVRGGAIDQNLILMDEVPLYYSSHLLGFFSIFNPDLINNFSVFKGNIPARYGGKLSSVVSVEMKRPENNKLKVVAGLGPVSNKASVNIPIIENKLSAIVGGRYSNPTWILKSVDDPTVKKSSANFYDVNFKATYNLSEKDVITTSFYNSDDFYDFGSDTSFNYQTTALGLSWNRKITEGFFGELNLYNSIYSADLNDKSEFRQFTFENGISSKGAKLSFDYAKTERLGYEFGAEIKQSEYDLGTISPAAGESAIQGNTLGKKNAIEFGVFAESKLNLTNRLSVTAGLRFSQFSIKEVNLPVFADNLPKSSLTIVDTLNSNSYVNLNSNLEPRVSTNFRIDDVSSVKGSYTRSVQYEHLFSNSTASLPTDLWLPTSNNLVPAISDQFSVGYFRNLAQNKWETSIEVYFKNFSQVNLLKTGAEVLLNETIEADIVQGNGDSKGVEILFRKLTGNVTGWISYFYSKTRFVTENRFLEEQINNGQIFNADFDRPHNLNLSMNFQLSRLWSMSSNFIYNTGRPVTIPNSSYVVNGVRIFNIAGRNNFRTPDTHRLDLSFTLEGSNKLNKRLSNSFTFSFYNIYGRRNPFSIVTKAVNNSAPRTFKLSVLGNIIPSFTYNLRFE